MYKATFLIRKEASLLHKLCLDTTKRYGFQYKPFSVETTSNKRSPIPRSDTLK